MKQRDLVFLPAENKSVVIPSCKVKLFMIFIDPFPDPVEFSEIERGAVHEEFFAGSTSVLVYTGNLSCFYFQLLVINLFFSSGQVKVGVVGQIYNRVLVGCSVVNHGKRISCQFIGNMYLQVSRISFFHIF